VTLRVAFGNDKEGERCFETSKKGKAPAQFIDNSSQLEKQPTNECPALFA
jgi:hypothetical protein